MREMIMDRKTAALELARIAKDMVAAHGPVLTFKETPRGYNLYANIPIGGVTRKVVDYAHDVAMGTIGDALAWLNGLNGVKVPRLWDDSVVIQANPLRWSWSGVLEIGLDADMGDVRRFLEDKGFKKQ
jgi:hypothetical protein